MCSINKIVIALSLLVFFANNINALSQNHEYELSKLLAYVDQNERDLIEQLAEDPQIDLVVKKVIDAEWNELFKTFGHRKVNEYHWLSFIVINAFKQGKITLEDLATCFIFHRTMVNFKDAKIMPLSEMPPTIETHRDRLNQIAEGLPLNQRYVIMLSQYKLDAWTQNIIFGTFIESKKDKIPVGMLLNRILTKGYMGFMNLTIEEYGITSFGLMNSLNNLHPVIHLTPSTNEMAESVMLEQNDFALLFPHEKVLVHGSADMGFWVHLHDLLHTYARSARLSENRELYLHALKLFRNLYPDADQIRKNYQAKLDDGFGKVAPNYKPGAENFPTFEEQVVHIWDILHGFIADGDGNMSDASYYTFGLPNMKKGCINDGVEAASRRRVGELTSRQYFIFILAEVIPNFKKAILGKHGLRANQIDEERLKESILDFLIDQ